LADLSIKIGHTIFKNPIFVASGTFGYGTENPELVDVSNIGAIVTKSITLNPRDHPNIPMNIFHGSYVSLFVHFVFQ